MNIEAIDFLNRLNESGAIDYASYSHLHDLLTSEEPEWEYGLEDLTDYVETVPMYYGADEARERGAQYNPPREVRRRIKAGPWEPVGS